MNTSREFHFRFRGLLLPALLAVGMMGGVSVAAAQDQSDGPDPDSLPSFNSIRTPVSPAFTLLGIEPTSVERPNTPSDLAASVVNRTNNFQSIPKDFALEVSPYWLFSHRQLSWQDDQKRSIVQSFVRTATLSVATAQVGPEDATSTALAFGGRASLASGHLSAKTVDALKSLESRLSTLSKVFAEIERVASHAADSAWQAQIKAAKNSDEREAANQRHTATLDSISALATRDPKFVQSRDAISEDYQDFAEQREGLLVELAAGAVGNAPSGVADSLGLTRWGAWVTVGYEMPSVSLVGVFRYLGNKETVGSDMIDNGVRIIYTTGRVAISGEYIDRHFLGANTPPNQWRLAGVVDYKIGSDLWLTGTFGRDYDKKSAGSLLAQLGLSVGFSKQRTTIPH